MDFFDVPEGVTLFETAEEAALADWAATPAAQARVVEVRPSDNATALWVVLQLGAPTGFHDQDIVTCVRTTVGGPAAQRARAAVGTGGGTASRSPSAERVPRPEPLTRPQP